MTTLQMLLAVATLGQTDAAESLQELRARAESTRLTFDLAEPPKSEFVSNPVFRYSDQLRHIKDAGLWIWTVSGRPVSALKVEHYEQGVHVRPWIYCFTSLSDSLVTAEWKQPLTFRATKPGITWQKLADPPADSRSARFLQMRDFARRFSAELVGMPNTLLTDRHQMRLIPRPLYRYEGSDNSSDGALFGFTGTGTNPDLLLLLDRPANGSWQFGLAGMTADGVSVKLGDSVVWERPHTGGKGRVFENWAYYLVD